MASPQTPSSGGRTSFEERYDRSTRLWGADGQRSLAESHVVLLGASATGCEILKNIVLPGLGRFSIVDDAAITKQDLGKNFFLRPNSLGKNIAEETVHLIKELNPFVEAHAFAESPTDFVQHGGHGFLHGHVAEQFSKSEDPVPDRPKIFNRPSWKATHIIVSSNRVPLSVLTKLCNTNSNNCPIFYVGSNGMTASMRIFAPEQPVIDTVPGPDEKLFDPRVIHHFPALKELFDKLNPEDPALEHDTFFHLPWPAIVYHGVRKWRAANNKTEKDVPKTFPEFKQVGAFISEMSKIQTDAEKPGAVPEGFDEAKVNLNSCFNFDRLPSELAHVLAEAPHRIHRQDVTPFWVLMNAVREFREEKGYLPLQPALPDFTTTTQIYLNMSRIFKAHHEVEVADIQDRCFKWLKIEGNHSLTQNDFEIAKIRHFVTNIRFCQYRSYPSLQQEFGSDFAKPFTFTKVTGDQQKVFPVAAKSNEATGTNASALGWYTAIRAAILFASQNNNRFPGQVSSADDVSNSTEEDEKQTLKLAQESLWGDALLSTDGGSNASTASLPENVKQQVLEIVRYGGSEMGHIAAIMGAVASQEIIKFIQHKRVPATFWCIFDGNTSKFIQVEQQQ